MRSSPLSIKLFSSTRIATGSSPGTIQSAEAGISIAEAPRIMIRFFLASVIASSLSSAPAITADDVLSRARKHVEQFWTQFSNVHCTEVVLQTKIGDNGKPLLQRQSTFDYL